MRKQCGKWLQDNIQTLNNWTENYSFITRSTSWGLVLFWDQSHLLLKILCSNSVIILEYWFPQVKQKAHHNLLFRILGIVFLIFGFLTLVGSLIYCVAICRDAKTPAQVASEDHYWTRHWSKNIGAPPEIHYRADDKYSDRY